MNLNQFTSMMIVCNHLDDQAMSKLLMKLTHHKQSWWHIKKSEWHIKKSEWHMKKSEWHTEAPTAVFLFRLSESCLSQISFV